MAGGQQGMGGQQTGGMQQMGGTSGQQMGGQQMGGQQMGGMGGQQIHEMRLQDAITPEMRTALEAFADAEDACEWCAEACVASGNPAMAECIRLCRDVADLAGINQKFLARDSIFGQEAAAVFQRAARECAQECAQHSDAHCQECAQVLERAAQSTEAMLRSLAGQPSQPAQQVGTAIGGMGGQQMGGQPTTGGMGGPPTTQR
jgi:hypothetical protein